MIFAITSAATLADCVVFPPGSPDGMKTVDMTDDEGYQYAEIRSDSDYIYVSRDGTNWVPAWHVHVGDVRVSDPDEFISLINRAAERLIAELIGGEKPHPCKKEESQDGKDD